AETAWVRNLLLELHAPLTTATLVYCDNVSVVYLSTNPVQHQRTKHIEIDIHFVRDYVASGHVRVLHVPSRFLTPQIQGSAGGLPRLKLSLHSCSLTGTISATLLKLPFALVLPDREHECNGSFNLGRSPALS
ncbi:ribonuclease H-like domain-containing protein, partial [Tanacetum coccineum]